MKANANTQPNRLQKLGNYWQIRWNIVRNDKTDEDGNTYESWDYEYANCKSPYREGIIEGIIRSVYTQPEVESIFANYMEGSGDKAFTEFQKVRELARRVADNENTDISNYNPEIFKIPAAKRLLQKVANPILSNAETLTEQDIEDAKSLYDNWNGEGIDYQVGNKVVYNNELYEVIQSHSSQNDWTPDVVPALFNKFKPAGQVNEWDYPVAYALNEEVTYNGTTYKCIQAHTSQEGWKPDSTASLWSAI